MPESSTLRVLYGFDIYHNLAGKFLLDFYKAYRDNMGSKFPDQKLLSKYHAYISFLLLYPFLKEISRFSVTGIKMQ